MNQSIKHQFEYLLNCRIYRNSLPRGTDIYYDIDRHYGIHNFRTVFDLGANVGQSAISYHSKFPQAEIYSFEPVASTFRTLEENTGHLEKRLHLFNCGMGNSPGKEEIHLNEDSKINSIKHNESSVREEIEIDSIDAFTYRNGIKVIDFLKIDTEGYELEVLEGARNNLTRHAVGMVYIESEPAPTDKHFVPFQELLGIMTGFGYHLFGIYEQQQHWSGEKDILFFNPVFISRELAGRNVTPDTYPLNRFRK